jgi:hypothetical protein
MITLGSSRYTLRFHGVQRRRRFSGGWDTAAVPSTVGRDTIKLEQSRFVFSQYALRGRRRWTEMGGMMR